MTEDLSGSQAFKQNYPHNMRGILPRTNRGEGPEYLRILRDVAKRNKVSFNKYNTDEQIEQYTLQKLFYNSINRATDEELKEILKELGYPTANFARQMATATLMTAWKAGGFQSYILIVSVVNAVMKFLVGRGLSFIANVVLTRMASIMMGPV